MNKRTFIKSTVLGISSLGLGCSSLLNKNQGLTGKTHSLTLSFDDGFKKSFYKVAEIFEAHGLSACFNVIASGHLPSFQKVDDWILPELLGNFDDWNALKRRGHEVMPHSWKHLNLARQPLEESKELILKCLDYFTENLEGYENEEAVFNFPFNSSTQELEEFTLSKVLAIRSYENNESSKDNLFRKGCRTMGPTNIDSWVDKQIKNFLKSKGGWLVLNVHGLDDEGWGPMSSDFLSKLLTKLISVEKLEILPTGYVLNNLKALDTQ